MVTPDNLAEVLLVQTGTPAGDNARDAPGKVAAVHAATCFVALLR